MTQSKSGNVVDLVMMRRCIDLSRSAASDGEFPFVSLICNEQGIVTEVINRVNRDLDVTRHAELMAVSEAQKVLGRHDLSDCAIYSNVEPCAMCSFPIRETRIAKVVFAIQSPLMGGFSKFGVLQDSKMSETMPEFFGEPPEVIGGLLVHEAEQVWRDCHPIVWAVIRYRGCFGGNPNGSCTHWRGPSRKRRFNWHEFAQMMMLIRARTQESSFSNSGALLRPDSENAS